MSRGWADITGTPTDLMGQSKEWNCGQKREEREEILLPTYFLPCPLSFLPHPATGVNPSPLESSGLVGHVDGDRSFNLIFHPDSKVNPRQVK